MSKEQRWVNPEHLRSVADQLRTLAVRADSDDGVVRLSAQQAHDAADFLQRVHITKAGDLWLDEDYD